MVGAMLAVDATEGEGLAFLQSKILSLLSPIITATNCQEEVQLLGMLGRACTERPYYADRTGSLIRARVHQCALTRKPQPPTRTSPAGLGGQDLERGRPAVCVCVCGWRAGWWSAYVWGAPGGSIPRARLCPYSTTF